MTPTLDMWKAAIKIKYKGEADNYRYEIIDGHCFVLGYPLCINDPIRAYITPKKCIDLLMSVDGMSVVLGGKEE